MREFLDDQSDFRRIEVRQQSRSRWNVNSHTFLRLNRHRLKSHLILQRDAHPRRSAAAATLTKAPPTQNFNSILMSSL